MLRRYIFASILVAVATTAEAHLASDSYLRLEIGQDGAVTGQWDIALRDLDVAVGLDADQDGAITWGELRAKASEVEAYAFARLTLAGEAGPCRITPKTLMIDHHAGSAYAVLPFAADCPSSDGLTLRYKLLFDIDPSHRGLLTIAGGERTSSEVLTPEHAEIRMQRAPPALLHQVAQFLRFGFDHILLGYDHLLFIAVLLITAAFRRAEGNRWVPIDGLGRVLAETIKVLTAFTLAHALVLSAAVFGAINVTTRLVEPAVAMTIMLAAIDNIRAILPRLRWQVAFLFGLIHGLSFATALGPMRLPPGNLALALGAFNLGVEAGQIALALLLVPIVFALRYEAMYRRVAAPAASVAAILLAGVWLADRLLALDFLPLQAISVASGIR